MILGVTPEDWIDTLSLKEQDKYLALVDNLVIVTEEDRKNEPPFYYVKGDYPKVVALLKELSLCKAYPQKTLFSANFSIAEIPHGCTPEKLKEDWVNELQSRHLV